MIVDIKVSVTVRENDGRTRYEQACFVSIAESKLGAGIRLSQITEDAVQRIRDRLPLEPETE